VSLGHFPLLPPSPLGDNLTLTSFLSLLLLGSSRIRNTHTHTHTHTLQNFTSFPGLKTLGFSWIQVGGYWEMSGHWIPSWGRSWGRLRATRPPGSYGEQGWAKETQMGLWPQTLLWSAYESEWWDSEGCWGHNGQLPQPLLYLRSKP
jgi:hypothetical protein